MKIPFFVRYSLRRVISYILRYVPAGKFSDILLWPVSHRLFGGGYTEVVTVNDGLRMRVYGDMEDMVNKTLLFASDFRSLSWEPVTARLVLLLAPHIRCAVVAGAHIGYYPLIIATANANAAVYAFEPNPVIYERFIDNVKLNHVLHVNPFHAALGDATGRQKMFFDHGQSSLIDTPRKHAGAGMVQVMTLNDVFNNRPDIPDLLIFDAEGYEPRILHGASRILDRAHPDIVFELNPNALRAAGSSPEELCAMLTRYGYSIFIIQDDYSHHIGIRSSSIIKLFPYGGSLPNGISFVNAFATIHPERIHTYL